MNDIVEEGYHWNANKTKCKNGHELNIDNTYIRPNGNRTCKKCNKLAKRKSRLAI